MDATKASMFNRLLNAVKSSLPVIVGLATFTVLYMSGGSTQLALTELWLVALLALWVFAVMLWTSFHVVRHADTLADILGEPYGTLILTLAVIVIEVSLIASIMLIGDAAPTLARDTMLAALMVVLNGLVGGALLIGGLVHREQDYNLRGARAFISVLIPLAVFSLVLPVFTVSTEAPTFSPGQAFFFAFLTALLYGVFLAIQTGRHKAYFLEETQNDDMVPTGTFHGNRSAPARSIAYHAVFLILTLLPIVLLSKDMARFVDYGTSKVGIPPALGGVIVAILVLTPEGIAALKAAYANYLQRSINLLLGAALSTIGLTVPAVLGVGLVTGQAVILGLDEVQIVLLMLTLLLSSITFGGVRTNLLQGAVHLVIFLAYLLLVFTP